MSTDDSATGGTAGTAIERFCTRSRGAGAAVTRVPIAEATAALAEACEPPIVAAQLPWADVELPDGAILDPTPAQLEVATTGVTPAIGGIADYGSLLLRSTDDGVEPVSLYPERHVAVLHESAVLPSVTAALSTHGDAFRDESASVILATGPSATADMGELVVGAHGPMDVHVILLEEGDREEADDAGESDGDGNGHGDDGGQS